MKNLIIFASLAGGIYLLFSNKQSFAIPNILQNYKSAKLNPVTNYKYKNVGLNLSTTLGVNSITANSYKGNNFNFTNDICNPKGMSNSLQDMLSKIVGGMK